MNNKVFIIAEAGVNHNGSIKTAKKMIDLAAGAGADAIKFQTFKAASMVTNYVPKARYQKKFTDKNESQFGMIKKLELNKAAHKELISYCKEKKIIFLSSPFDLEGVGLLIDLGLKIIKIPSGEITNLPYLRKIGGLNKKIIISTGMADLKEVRNALGILTSCGTKKENIAILHCTSEYPAPIKDVNLRAMLTLKDKLKVNVGYSDHTLGIEVSIAAVALGASVIEKHFTLSRKMKGPDHQASLEPEELKSMVKAIRNIERALGNGIKKPSQSELRNIPLARKSIVALKDIKRGDIFSEQNITVKRPGIGMSPLQWDKIVGKMTKRDFKADEIIAG